MKVLYAFLIWFVGYILIMIATRIGRKEDSQINDWSKEDFIQWLLVTFAMFILSVGSKYLL